MDAVTSKIVVAQVTKVDGIVFAKSPDGTMRVIKVGDALFKGDVVITDPGSNVEFKHVDGSQTRVAEQQTVMLDDEVVGSPLPTATDSAVAALQPTEVAKVLQAVNTGEDINIVLDETAAGLTGSGVDQGHFVVKVQRGHETLKGSIDSEAPPNVELGSNTGNPVELIRIGELINPLGHNIKFNPGNLPGVDGSKNTDILAALKTNTPAVLSAGTGSVTEDVNVDAAGKLVTTGTLSISDVNAGQNAFTPGSATGTYGTLVLLANGSWTYSAVNANPSIQALSAGQTLTDKFVVASVDGTTTTVTVTIIGTNDVPVIAGVSTGAVTEDVAVTAGNLTTNGALTITDVDAGQSNFTAQASTAGSYGTFTLNAAGNWTYTANNALAAIQSLGAGQSLTDTFTAVSSDGSASQVVTVTIHGTNDVPVIAGVSTGAVTEDVSVTAGNLTTSGALTITDVDAGQSNFTAQASTAGSYGTFTLNAAGNWTYTANNAQTAIQQLGAGQSLTDTFTAVSSDGTASQVVTVTIHGTNDAPVIGGVTTGAVTEDVAVNAAGNLVASGALTIVDTDAGQSSFAAQTATTGTYGSFSVDAAGNWTYTAANANAAIQALGAGQTLTETFNVKSIDGTPTPITVTITGTNDAPVIGGTTTGAVTEDVAVNAAGNLVASGALTIVDTDAGQSSFAAQTATAGAYGSFSVDAAGNWTYTAANAQTAIQQLGAGQTLTETFNVVSADGTITPITVTITGTNDVPVIGGVAAGGVTQDVNVTAGNLTTSGALTIVDIDAGQSNFTAQASVTGTYGTFTLDAAGNWTYTANNALAAIQALGVGQSLTDTFTAVSSDGTASHVVTVTIHGTNNIPVIGGVSTGAVTEDVAVTAGNLVTSGALTIVDADAGQSNFTAQAVTPGSNGYGTFTLDAAGNWTYTANNAQTAIQQLGAGQSITDSFTAVSSDGTASQVITVTINGTNDVPVISGGVSTGAVTEDVAVNASGNLVTNGALIIVDTDAGQSNFAAQTNTAGAYGTFTLDAAGNWTYTANNAQTAIQQLGVGQSITDSFTAVSSDGTASQVVTVTIHGTNDVPVIGSVSTGAVTEDVAVTAGNLVTGGALTIADVDQGQSNFTAQASTASAYGTFTLDAAGNWTYTANNAQTAIQQLGAGQSITDSFTAVSSDGTASQVVTVTIHGTNDVPVIGSVSTGAVTEDVAVTAGNLVTGGALTIADVDQGQSNFTAQASTAGAFGTFTLDAAGNWTYTANNAQTAIQQLGVGQSITDSFTAVSSDGTANQVVTVTINGTNDAPVLTVDAGVTVSERDLVQVLAGAVTLIPIVASGTFAFSDVDKNATLDVSVKEPAATVTSGGQQIQWTGGTAGTDLVGSVTHGTTTTEIIRVHLVKDAAGAYTGAYQVTLSGPVDHGGQAAMNLDFGVSVSDGIAATPGAFTVQIIDGQPVAGNMVQGIIETQGPAGPINLMIVIDKSASMAELSGIQKVGANGQPVVDANGNPVYMTRFEVAQAAAIKLINDYVAQVGTNNVKVNLMDFSSGASTKYLLGYWMTADQALNKLSTYTGITPMGGTNYDTALADTMAAFNATNSFAPQGVKFDPATTPGLKNAIYFLSDGLPTAGSGDTSTLTGLNVSGNSNSDAAVTPLPADVGIQAGGELNTWTNFLTANQINSYALSMGATTAGGYNPSNLDPVPYLNPIAYDASGATPVDTNGMVITNLNQLPLVAAPVPVNGNVLTANTIYAHGGFGADGGTFTSFTIDGASYNSQGVVTGTSAGTFDAATGTWTIHTNIGGQLVMHMATGNYTYTPISTMNATVTEDIAFTLTDRDGNAANGTYRLNVSYDGVVNGTAGNDVMIGSNGNDVIIGGTGNDTLTGGLGADVFKWGVNDHGAAGTPSVDTITDFDTTATSDKLDLRDLLQGESGAAATGTAGSLDGYLHFETVANAGGGTDTIVHVSSTGGFSGGYAPGVEDQKIVLQGFDALAFSGQTADLNIAQDMINKGKLVTD